MDILDWHVYVAIFKIDNQRSQTSRWKLSIRLSMDTSGLDLPMQKILQNTTWELEGVPDLQKVIYKSMKKLVR